MIHQFQSGAIRGDEVDHLDYLSIPLVGLIGVARTAREGAIKYGRWNYMKGIPASDCVNHAINHLVLWGTGDRSEPHLEHAAWNLLAAIQSMTLNPELNQDLPGPGYRVNAQPPIELDDDQAWSLSELPEIMKLLKARNEGHDGSQGIR